MDPKAVARRLAKGTGQNYEFNEESRAFNLLASFQLVELSLKIYISLAYEVIRRRVDGLLPFNHDEKSLEKASLERLLGMLKVINNNQALGKLLASLIEKRNDIAHRMLLPHFGIRRRNEDLRKAHDELTRTEKSVNRAMKGLAREIVAVKSVLEKISA